MKRIIVYLGALLCFASSAQVVNGSAADLWSKFFMLLNYDDHQGAYYVMKELCLMDRDVGLEEKFSRWSYCASRHVNDGVCVSKSAINDQSRFYLGMNCKVVMLEDSRNVRFGRPVQGKAVNYNGIAYRARGQ